MQSYDGVMHSICVTKKLCKKYEIFLLGNIEFLHRYRPAPPALTLLLQDLTERIVIHIVIYNIYRIYYIYLHKVSSLKSPRDTTH